MGDQVRYASLLNESTNEDDVAIDSDDYPLVVPDASEDASPPIDKGCGDKIRHILKGPERLWSVLYASVVASLGSVIFGYAFGFPSPAILQLANSNFIRNVSHADFQENSKVDIFAGLSSAGAVAGGLVFGIVSDLTGRKLSMIITWIVFLVGWTLIALSRLAQGAAFFSVIYIGMFLVGCGYGSANIVVPMFISEISPPNLRGFLGNLPELGLDIGLCLVYALAAIPYESDSYDTLSYYYLAAIAFSMVLASLFLLIPVKESPHWLIHKGREVAAKKSLKWLRGSKVCIESEFKKLLDELVENKEHSLKETLKMIPKPTVWKPLILLLVILSLQQLVGITAVDYFGAPIFKTAGVQNPNEAAAFTIGLFQLVGIIFCLILADCCGRKRLLLASSFGLTLSTFGMGVFFIFYLMHNCESSAEGEHKNVTHFTGSVMNVTAPLDVICGSGFSWLAIVSISLYSFSFELGWGGIPRLLAAEYFPISVRGKCMGIAFFANWSFGLIISFSFNSYQAAVMPYGVFWTFAGFSLLSFFFVLIFIPETKGKTLHEIEENFTQGTLCLKCHQHKTQDITASNNVDM